MIEKYVETNGHRNFVYGHGEGAPVIVLLSGSGVPFPSFEYSDLAKSLAETFQVIGIEKLGYGHSDLAEDNRMMDDVIQEYRCVLQELGVKTPVILAAHSMGFLEALRWGQQYPSEISGILGLDPATPECYGDFDVEAATKGLIEMSQDEAFRKATATALVEQLVKEQALSPAEQKELEALAFRNFANQNWISEAENLRESIDLVVQNGPYLQVPMLFFLSNGEGTTLDQDRWRQYAQQYLSHIKVAQSESFDYPHNLYKFVNQEIAQTARTFFTKYIG